MTLSEVSKAPDRPPLPSEAKKITELGGIQEIMAHLQKGEWAPMVGAILTMWKEYFGTPEEKAEVARARAQGKLDALHTDVDETQKTEDKPTKEDSSKKSGEEPKEDVEVGPYKPGAKEPHVSPKNTFRGQVEEIYKREDTIFTVNNLREHFGRNYKKFIIEKDPVTKEEPITFLGRPISGGINLMMLPFLKIAERNLMDQGLNYIPKQKEVRGFQDRNMCVARPDGTMGDHPNIPSFHKYGLAVDLDPDSNWPKDGRGNIPDEVILAMAEAGFACGNIADPSFYYLMNDTMHYQMRFPPDSPAGQKIINESPIGKRYWNSISPMLNALKEVA